MYLSSSLEPGTACNTLAHVATTFSLILGGLLKLPKVIQPLRAVLVEAAREQDEYVHFVLPYHLRSGLVAERADAAPCRLLLEPVGQGVGLPDEGVEEDLEGIPVMVLDDGLEVVADRMHAEIRRHVSDSQFLARMRAGLERWRRPAARAEAPPIGKVFLEQ
jgi:hypothetical protein